jgi:ABC-type glycerol-3-phosphate transport system permease component
MSSVAAPARARGQLTAARAAAERAHLRRRLVWWALAYLVLLVMAAVAIIPFLYVISLSFKQTESLVTYPPRWIPIPPYYGNYVQVLTTSLFPRWFLNTLVVASAVTVIKLIIDSMAGYAFAKMEFPLRESLFLLALSMLMIPVATTLIPMYLLVRGLGLQNTYPGIMLPALAAPMGIFLMRTFMEQLPRDLENAARLDGASEPYIFARIILPLCKPALVTLAIFTFLTQWVAFVWPLVIAPDPNMFLLTTGLSSFKAQYRVNWGLVAGGMVLVLVPTALAFVLFMRQFIAGSLAGALKQ